MHNGALAKFGSVKRDLTLGLREDPVAALGEAIQAAESVGREHGVRFPVQGTVAVSDGTAVWAFRYSSQRQTRTLFHSAPGIAPVS